MSKIPEKFGCDYGECPKTPVTWDEAINHSWYLVVYSDMPKYVAINKWNNSHSIPERLKARTLHACCLEHALVLLENAAINL